MYRWRSHSSCTGYGFGALRCNPVREVGMANRRLRKELLEPARGLHAAGAIDFKKLHREERLPVRGKKDKRLTWEGTYRETAREKEDWSDLDATVADGIS